MNDHNTTTPLNPNDVLKLFNLEDKNIEDMSITHLKDGMHISVKLECIPHICPICGHTTSQVKDYYNKRITHSILNRTPCFIDYRARRLICRHCHKTFYEHNPFTMDHMKISLATVYNILTDLKNPRTTFTEVAKRYHVSPTSATSLFDKHVHIARRPLPKYLCIDEVYGFKSYNSKYVCVLLDYTSQNIVDVLPSRHKDELINYLSLIPKEERDKVQLCSFDMWETYRIVCKIMFPKCRCCIDHFHVIQELNRQVDKVRIRIMNEKARTIKSLKNKKDISLEETHQLKVASQHYYVLKKFNWMFFTNNNKIFDPNNEKKYNSVLCQYMNWYDILDYMIHIDNDLDIALDLKDLMVKFYSQCNIKTAKSYLESLISDLQKSTVAEMNHFANTIVKWKYEIINSFIIVDQKIDKNNNIINKRINNGIIENRNKSIKLLKHSSNGYLNWLRYRTRILYCLNDDANFSLYPYFDKKEYTNHLE